MQDKNIKIKNITYISILIALFIILNFFTIRIGESNKITFQNLPIFISTFMFGSFGGLIVAGIGMFLSQLLFNGLGPTTLLWCMPHIVFGLFVGILYNNFKNKIDSYLYKNENCVFAFLFVIISCLILTLLNTIALYIDSKIFAYYTFFLVFGSLVFRLIFQIITACIYAVILPPIMKRIKPFI